jgi:hypothetical protein
MNNFADHFREQAIPHLRERARFAGWMLALGEWGWAEAEHHVLMDAIMRGAGRLADSVFEDLNKWISNAIERQEAEFRPAIEAWRKRDSAITASTDAWNSALEERFGWASYQEAAPAWTMI